MWSAVGRELHCLDHFQLWWNRYDGESVPSLSRYWGLCSTDLLKVICVVYTVKYVSLENLNYHYYSQLKSVEIPKYSDRMSSYISECGGTQDV